MNSLLVTCDVQADPQTVANWERRLADCVLSQDHAWYTSKREQTEAVLAFLGSLGSESTGATLPEQLNLPLFFTFELHSLMGDSTNSAVAHQHKAHVLKLESTWKTLWFTDGENDDVCGPM